MTHSRNDAVASSAAHHLKTLVQVLRLAFVLVLFAYVAAWVAGVESRPVDPVARSGESVAVVHARS